MPLPLYAATPVLVCSDLTDGPTTGWPGTETQGAAVSVWGLNFGTSGHIDIAGQEIASTSCAEWNATTYPTTARGLGRITFYLNSSMTTGSTTITVTTADGTSNSVPFYTRALGTSKILFVAASGGSDSTTRANNNISNPWATLGKVRSTAEAGDCIYVRGGTYLAEDEYDAIMCFYNTYRSGTLNNSISVSAYPAEDVKIGDGSYGTSTSSCQYFVFYDAYGSESRNAFNYWTFSKLTIKIDNKAFLLYNYGAGLSFGSTGFRVVGNSIQHTYGGSTGGYGFSMNLYGNLNNLNILANYFPNCGYGGDYTGTAKYCIYLGGGPAGSGVAATSDYLYIGWNDFYNSSGRAVDIYGHVTNDYFDHVYVYNNFINTMGTSAFIVGGGDPNDTNYRSIGSAYIYNNIVTNAGSCSKFSDNTAGAHGGNFYIFNNTWHKQGQINEPLNHPPDFQVCYPTAATWKNNIVDSSSSSDLYWATGYDMSANTGDHNLWRGATDNPTWSTTGDIDDQDPKFSDSTPTIYTDFQLASDSPCRNAGTVISTYGAPWDTYDFYGVARGASWDIGAYEYTTGEASVTRVLVNGSIRNGTFHP